jgi:hypothetical protein
LPDGQQRQQRAAVLGAIAKLDIVGRQPGDQTGVTGIDQSEIESQRPGAALANNRDPGKRWSDAVREAIAGKSPAS